MVGSPLMKNVLKILAKSVLVPLGLFGSWTTALIISNKEIKGILKIVKHFEESGFMVKDVSKSIDNEEKEQSGGFLS